MGCYSGVHGETSGDTPRKSSICFFAFQTSPKQKWTKWIIHSSSAIFDPTKKNRCHRPQVCAPALWHDFTRSCGMLKLFGHGQSWPAGEIVKMPWKILQIPMGLSPFFPMFFYGCSKVRLRGLGLAARLGSSGGIPEKSARFLGGKMVNKRETHGETWGKSWGKWGSWIDMAVLFLFLLGIWMSWAYFQTKHLNMWRDLPQMSRCWWNQFSLGPENCWTVWVHGLLVMPGIKLPPIYRRGEKQPQWIVRVYQSGA